MEQELQKEQKCSFYALEQLRQVAERILRGSARLLKSRAGVEKYRTAEPPRAYAYYLELQKTHEMLLAALPFQGSWLGTAETERSSQICDCLLPPAALSFPLRGKR